MTFLDPWRLVFLIIPVLLAIAYVVRQRARQKYAVRFTSVELLASVAPRRPGWQRHLPAVGSSPPSCSSCSGSPAPRRPPRSPTTGAR